MIMLHYLQHHFYTIGLSCESVKTQATVRAGLFAEFSGAWAVCWFVPL